MAQTKQTVLVVEDDAAMRQSLIDALQQYGFKVIHAADGKVALQLALKDHPDLILTDNILPGISGVDMATELRKDVWGRTVPVIILTGASDIASINQSLQAGVTDYIMKSDMGLDSIVALVASRLSVKAA